MLLTTSILSTTVVLWALASILVSIFACKPIRGYWDEAIKSTCINMKWFFIGNAVPNIVTDVVILGLPMRHVWELQMGKRTKTLVSAIFFTGGLYVPAVAV